MTCATPRADTPFSYALPHYGAPATPETLAAACVDARNACPLNITGGAEADALPRPLEGVYDPVGCFSSHVFYSRRETAADLALGWNGKPNYAIFFSQALSADAALSPTWYISRLYPAFKCDRAAARGPHTPR